MNTQTIKIRNAQTITVAGGNNYENLENKPSINNVELEGNKTLSELGIQPEGNYLTEIPSDYKTKTENDLLYQAKGNYASISDIPTQLSQLSDDTTHRLVSDTEKTTWNNKSNFSGSYNDLTNKPSLFSGDYNDLTNKPTIPTVPTNVSAFTNDAGYLTQHQDISGKLDTSKVKNTQSTTAGDVYDVRYINSTIGDIESLLGGI